MLWAIWFLVQLLNSAIEHKSSRRQYVNEQAWLCSNKIIDTEIRISCNLHVILFIFISSNHLKTYKAFLQAHGPHEDWICPMNHGSLTPGLLDCLHSDLKSVPYADHRLKGKDLLIWTSSERAGKITPMACLLLTLRIQKAGRSHLGPSHYSHPVNWSRPEWRVQGPLLKDRQWQGGGGQLSSEA